MLARPSHAFVIWLGLATVVAAQQPSYLPSNTPDANRLLADRVKFVKDNYTLDRSALDKLVTDLMALVPFQEKYMKDAGKTAYRLELAISIVASDGQTPEAERPARMERFRSQMGDLYAKAPLSLASVIHMADTAAPADAQMAHAKINAKFAGLLKGQPMVIEKLDGLLLPPSKANVPLPVISPGTPPVAPVQPATNNPPPVTSNTPPANSNLFMPPTPQNPTPPPPQPVLPAAPPRVVAPAPELDKWKASVDATMVKYDFNAEQKKIAERALDQCKLRAETAKTKSKADLDQAAKISDEKTRASKLTEVNKPFDTAYDELIQRVEALATAEQRAKLEKKQK